MRCHHGRHGIEIIIESLFADVTCSWVMIVNGINKYVTEMIEETQDDHIDHIGECTRKPVAKVRQKQTSMTAASSSTTTLPCHLRVSIDVEPGPYDKSGFEVSEKMRGCLNRLGFLKCPISQARRVSSELKCFLQEQISDRMFEQNWSLSSAQDLKPGDCRGSQMCPSGANF